MADLADAAQGTDVAKATGGGDGIDLSKMASSLMESEKTMSRDVGARNKAIDTTLQRVDKVDGDYTQRIQTMSKAYDKTLAEADKPAPKEDVRSPVETLGSVTGALAALSGLLTRHPLTASLNAAATAITAARQGDMDTFKREYDSWKASSDHALKIAGLQNEQMKSVLEDKKLSVDEQLAKVRAYAAANQDEIALQHARTGDLSTLWTLVQGRQELADKHTDLMDKIAADYVPKIEVAQAGRDLAKAKKEGDQAGIEDAQNRINAYNDTQGRKVGLTGSMESGLLAQKVAEFVQANKREPTADERTKMAADIKKMDKPPTVAQQKQDEKISEVASVLDLADDTINLVKGAKMSVGLSGRVGRPLETLANIMEASDSTTRRDIESNITTLRAQMTRLLNDRSIVTKLDHADAEKMVRGLEPGATVQNVESSIRTMQKLLTQKYAKDLKDAGFMGDAPPAGDKPATAGASPPASVLKEGFVTTFGNGQKWTLKDGKPSQVQ